MNCKFPFSFFENGNGSVIFDKNSVAHQKSYQKKSGDGCKKSDKEKKLICGNMKVRHGNDPSSRFPHSVRMSEEIYYWAAEKKNPRSLECSTD